MQNILIAGGTGLIGRHLAYLLKKKGYHVQFLSRKAQPNADIPTFAWDIAGGTIDEKAFSEADYIINLAGSGIADKRWTAARKKDIIESRTHSTLLIKKYLETKPHRVKALINASAIGYYGNRGADLLPETAAPGQGFLTESTVAWESAINAVAETGLRTVGLRIGVVLSAQGGALKEMLRPFLFGIGAYFGNGAQYFSWIHIDDVCNMFIWALENDTASGYYNAVAPHPLSNYDLTKAIATAKGGGYLMLPAPSFVLRPVMGEMADVIFNSTRVSSEKIEKAGFTFQFPEAVAALKDIFKRKI